MKYLLPIVSLALVGCIHEPSAGGLGVAPGTPPPDPAKVAACQKTRTWHNIWTISSTIFGAAAGAQGGLDSVTTDHTAQVGIGIGAASSGVLAAISATAAGIEADAYATDNCPAILTAAAATGVVSPNARPTP